MQISLNKNKTKGRLEYYYTFPGSCQSLMSAVASLYPGDCWELGLTFWADAQKSSQKDWASKV